MSFKNPERGDRPGEKKVEKKSRREQAEKSSSSVASASTTLVRVPASLKFLSSYHDVRSSGLPIRRRTKVINVGRVLSAVSGGPSAATRALLFVKSNHGRARALRCFRRLTLIKTPKSSVMELFIRPLESKSGQDRVKLSENSLELLDGT